MPDLRPDNTRRAADASSAEAECRMLQQLRLFRRVTGGVDGAGGAFQQADAEARGERVLDAVIDAIVGGKPCNINIRHPAGVQPGGELRVVALAVVAEGAVAVGVFIHAFAEDGGDAARIQRRMQRGAIAARNAVFRPQGLREAVQGDVVKRLFAGVGAGEALVSGGVPVLGGDDERVVVHGGIDRGDDGVAIGHGQGAAGHEVVLDVDEQ